MVTIRISNKKLVQQSTQAVALFLEKDFVVTKELESLAKTFFPVLSAVIKQRKFTGQKSSSLILFGEHNDAPVVLMLIGLGAKKQKKISVESYRRAVAISIRAAQANNCDSLAIQLPKASLFGVSDEKLAQETAIATEMAAYHFDTYITDNDRKVHQVSPVELVVGTHDKKALQKGLKKGAVIAQAVNACRHWIDLPPIDLCPPKLADKASAIAKESGLKCTIFNEKEINQMGMGGLAAVSRGSDKDARFVVLEYKTAKKNAPTIGLVGKGITYDSGGLSLKPPTYMETMKDDMSGAAAVIASMQALVELKPAVNVIAVTPLAENLPSGSAIKPGDIITFYNGKTAEIKNTDAEGRLILADGLSYAVKNYKLDALIDLATLTGSCAHALGPFFSGLMSQHEALAKKIESSAECSGDRVWPLPMDDDFRPAIKDPVADISNTGSARYRAGAITAAFFLQNFVGDVSWAHLDIAGTAFDVPDIPYYRTFGATGAGVRLLIDLVMNWK